MRPPVLWTGKLTRAMTLLVNISNAVAFVNGNARGISAMKERVRRGYDGEFSEDVSRYDALCLDLQSRAARLQLQSIDMRGKDVLDVGGGTGALTFLALEMGAASVTCGDISRGMLAAARDKADAQGYAPDRVTFRELDAESLPFPPESFDVALTGMTLGLLPRQHSAVSELARVTRGGGLVCVGAHGPEHYWEAIDASLRAIAKPRVFGYRLEFWPRTDTKVEAMLIRAGLTDARTTRVVWRNDFPSGADAHDFFAAVSALWWYAKFPPEEVARQIDRTRRYFEDHGITRVTDDVIFGYGTKGGRGDA
jgi:ubiquinone/menaquinone biosynthesis C-methylase UbiE